MIMANFDLFEVYRSWASFKYVWRKVISATQKVNKSPVDFETDDIQIAFVELRVYYIQSQYADCSDESGDNCCCLLAANIKLEWHAQDYDMTTIMLKEEYIVEKDNKPFLSTLAIIQLETHLFFFFFLLSESWWCCHEYCVEIDKILKFFFHY